MTLLSIVGDDISRIVPVLFVYKTMVKKHILLCDDDKYNYDRAKHLQRGMQRFSKLQHLDWDITIVIINEDIADDIVGTTDIIYYDEMLWLNATDGYPAVTILLSDIVRQRGGKIVSYDHFDNDLHIIETDGSMKTITLPASMDIESYMTLLDYKIIKKSNEKELLKRKELIFELYKNEASYSQLKYALVQQMNRSNFRFNFTEHTHTLDILYKLKIVDKHHRLIRAQQKVLQGDLLEEYLYWLCKPLGFDDVMVGVQIDFEHSKKTHPLPKIYNEFDLLIMHDNRLYTVECKFSNGLDGLSVVYKYDAIIDYFGKASKAIIANISSSTKESYMGMNASQNFSHSTLRRARMSGIAVYHEERVKVEKFQRLVSQFFNLKQEESI